MLHVYVRARRIKKKSNASCDYIFIRSSHLDCISVDARRKPCIVTYNIVRWIDSFHQFGERIIYDSHFSSIEHKKMMHDARKYVRFIRCFIDGLKTCQRNAVSKPAMHLIRCY